MPDGTEINDRLTRQLNAQNVGFLLGAGASYLNGMGYPLGSELWDAISEYVDTESRSEINAQLAAGSSGLEAALDALDNADIDFPLRRSVAAAIGKALASKQVDLTTHKQLVTKLKRRSHGRCPVFTLNYDVLLESACESARVEFVDGFTGNTEAWFEPTVFTRFVGTLTGPSRRQARRSLVDPTRGILPIVKLHGSLGWYFDADDLPRRRAVSPVNPDTDLMIPPQRRKANDTVLQPYSALWTEFRAQLIHDPTRILNRLVCVGYGFADEHVNDVIFPALARSDFTLIALARRLPETTRARLLSYANVLAITEAWSIVDGHEGPGMPDSWDFQCVVSRLA